jgi:Leucine-rich repeat (LRR) protein
VALLQLTRLRHLCLRTCGLGTLPAGIKHLAGLQALVLTDNDIAVLPAREGLQAAAPGACHGWPGSSPA